MRKEIKCTRHSLEKRLQSLGKSELIELLLHLRTGNDHFDLATLNWLKENRVRDDPAGKPNGTGLTDQLLVEMWSLAETIIEEFNEYGGGDESEEERAYDYLNELEEIAEKENVSREARRAVMDGAFEQYHRRNSGFVDALDDFMFSLCKDREDWKHLVSLYMKNPREWEKKRAMVIYAQHLGDDESYLTLRESQMKYGMDYWDLVEYYTTKGMDEEALEVAEKGILEGEGKCTELFTYLFDHYEKLDSTGDIDRLIRTAQKRKTAEREMLDRCFEYHRKKDNYDKASEYLLAGYEHIRWGGHFDYFMKLQDNIKREEWKKIESIYLEKIKEDNLKDYLSILMHMGEKAETLKLVLNPPRCSGNAWFRVGTDFTDEFASKLRADYPEEIAGYYMKRARKFILAGQRSNYRVARRYLEKVKEIYLEDLDDRASWRSAITRTRDEFKKRRALLEELEGIE